MLLIISPHEEQGTLLKEGKEPVGFSAAPFWEEILDWSPAAVTPTRDGFEVLRTPSHSWQKGSWIPVLEGG